MAGWKNPLQITSDLQRVFLSGGLTTIAMWEWCLLWYPRTLEGILDKKEKNQFIKTKSAKLVVWRGYWKNWRSVANVSLPRHRKKYQYGQDLMKGSWIDRWPLSYSLLASRGAHPGALFKNRSRCNKISRVCLPPIKRDAERSIKGWFIYFSQKFSVLKPNNCC